jgi:hypothetical protein
VGTNQQTSPAGAFYFDNQLSPGSDPVLDNNGLLFGFNGTSELNVYSIGVGSYQTQSFTPGAGWSEITASSFAITSQSPEPGTLAMLAVGLGLACIGGWRRRKAESKA